MTDSPMVATIGNYHGAAAVGYRASVSVGPQSGCPSAQGLPLLRREVVVKHFGNGVLLLPIDDPWQTMEAGLAAFEPGFELQRDQPDQQMRPAIQP